MSIIITKLEKSEDEDRNTVYLYPEYCVIKSQFCFDQDDDTFATIGLGGGTEITKAELLTRALDIQTRYPFLIPVDPPQPNPLRDRTTAEVETMVDDWCTEKNVA